MMRLISVCVAAAAMSFAGAAEAQKHGWQTNVPGANAWVWSGGIGLGQGRLGAQVQPLTDDLRRYFGAPKGQGVLVQRVTKGSPAAKAGLKAGDVILSVAGTAVARPMEIVTALATQPGAGKVTLKILRNKKRRTLKATLGSPQGFQGFQGFKNFKNLRSALRSLKTLDALKNFNINIPDIDIQIPDVRALLKGHKSGTNKKLRKQLEQTQKRVKDLERRLKRLESKRAKRTKKST